jgi:hypothetical protein
MKSFKVYSTPLLAGAAAYLTVSFAQTVQGEETAHFPANAVINAVATSTGTATVGLANAQVVMPDTIKEGYYRIFSPPGPQVTLTSSSSYKASPFDAELFNLLTMRSTWPSTTYLSS